jgi:dihydrodipicolinate synthase/N-acetylneuraminate lyase
MTSWNEFGKVDTWDIDREVRYVLPYIDILFPAGNAGEGTKVDFQNWCTLITAVINSRNINDPRKPVLAGILRGSASEVSVYSRTAQELGADGIVIAPMLGENPTDILEAALRGSNLDIVLYNNPQMHKNFELPVKFVQNARDYYPDRVKGIKVSTRDFNVFKQMLCLKTDSFKVLQGNTADDATSISLGVDGIVPVEACSKPEVFRALYDAGKPESLGRSSEEVAKILGENKSEKEKLNLNTFSIIKRELVGLGIFKSSRMYGETG